MNIFAVIEEDRGMGIIPECAYLSKESAEKHASKSSHTYCYEIEVVDIPKNTIRVWQFEDAPKEYKILSPHRGDEDWVAFIPDHLGIYISWIEEGTPFGCCSVSTHEVAGGIIKIGAHA